MSKITLFILVIALSVICTMAAPRKSKCVCVNTKEMKPVCGSNGVTYSNPGELRCHNKCNKDNVTLAHYGDCKSCDKQELKALKVATN